MWVKVINAVWNIYTANKKPTNNMKLNAKKTESQIIYTVLRNTRLVPIPIIETK